MWDCALKEIAEGRAQVAVELAQSNSCELQEVNRRLKETQAQLIQHEKDGFAGATGGGDCSCEINNPLAFVMNNLFIVESGLRRPRPGDRATALSEPSLLKLRKARGAA